MTCNFQGMNKCDPVIWLSGKQNNSDLLLTPTQWICLLIEPGAREYLYSCSLDSVISMQVRVVAMRFGLTKSNSIPVVMQILLLLQA